MEQRQSVLWAWEFGREYAVPAEVVASLVDQSWHNDVCPSFSHPDADLDSDYSLRLWVEHVDPAMREDGDRPRYAVGDGGDLTGGAFPAVMTDDLAEALAVLARYAGEIKARRAAGCSFCYGAHTVSDCPNIDPEQLAEEQGCPECERSNGPHYRGVCRHGSLGE